MCSWYIWYVDTLPCAWISEDKKTLMGKETGIIIQNPVNPQLWKVMKTLKEFEIWWAVITMWWLEPWIMWDLDQRYGHVNGVCMWWQWPKYWHTTTKRKGLELFADLAEEIGKLPEYLNSIISGDNSCYSTMILEFKKKKPPVDQRSKFKDATLACEDSVECVSWH